MAVEQATEYLNRMCTFGIKLGLQRIQALLTVLGNPQERFRSVHVAGTNGKGSTVAMLAAILRQSGCRTGVYTSPHLLRYEERIVVNGAEIKEGEFQRLLEEIDVAVQAVVRQGEEHPTEFEILTAAAFLHFARSGVEWAVIETGLGGLLDSTNVLRPAVAVITNVAFDHMDRCGNTLTAIAKQKAGILKNGIPVVTAAQGESLAVIKARAAEIGCSVYVLNEHFMREDVVHDGRQWMRLTGADGVAYGPWELGLLGINQGENAAVAAQVALLLQHQEERVEIETIRRGLATAHWPARFEVLQRQPGVVLDGAHNPAGAISLQHNLEIFFPAAPRIFVAGFLRDKDIPGIANVLFRPGDKVFLVAPDSERACPPEEAEIMLPSCVTAIAMPDLAAALAAAKRELTPAGVLCVTGSLYLMGQGRTVLKGERDDI